MNFLSSCKREKRLSLVDQIDPSCLLLYTMSLVFFVFILCPLSCHERSLAPSSSGLTAIQNQRSDWINYQDWSFTLQQVVLDQGVDYLLLKQGEARRALDRFIKQLADPIPTGSSREARLAFWINAYNAMVLSHVLDFPEISSVSTAVANAPRYQFFKQQLVVVAGKKRSLDEIEHQILRPIFKDPRVHFAINCASRSCPPLAAFPYLASQVDDQLNQAVKNFLNTTQGLNMRGGDLYLSKLFQWFEDDFNQDMMRPQDMIGPDHQGIRSFLQKHLAEESWSRVKTARLFFQEYDWSLNRAVPNRSTHPH